MARIDPPVRATMRLDKWLVQARFFRTRALSAEVVTSGHLRLNGQKTRKIAQAIGDGDTLTFPQGGRIRVIRVLDMPQRRGPASEAAALYLDLAEDVPHDGMLGE